MKPLNEIILDYDAEGASDLQENSNNLFDPLQWTTCGTSSTPSGFGGK